MALTRGQIDTIARLAAARYSGKEMAAATGASIYQVRYQLRKLGLGDPHRRRPKRWTTEKLLGLRGYTAGWLRKTYGLSAAEARRVIEMRNEVLAAHGLPRRHRLGALYDRAYNLKRSLRPGHKAYKREWMRAKRAQLRTANGA